LTQYTDRIKYRKRLAEGVLRRGSDQAIDTRMIGNLKGGAGQAPS
jgi:hypothetical protein